MVTCPICKGDGVLYAGLWDHDGIVDCSSCETTGKVTEEKAEELKRELASRQE